MTSTEAMTSYSLITSSRVFPRALGTASAESTRNRRGLEVELPFHYTVGTSARVCVCSAICVHLLPAVVGKVRFGTYRRLSHLVHSLLWMSC